MTMSKHVWNKNYIRTNEVYNTGRLGMTKTPGEGLPYGTDGDARRLA